MKLILVIFVIGFTQVFAGDVYRSIALQDIEVEPEFRESLGLAQIGSFRNPVLLARVDGEAYLLDPEEPEATLGTFRLIFLTEENTAIEGWLDIPKRWRFEGEISNSAAIKIPYDQTSEVAVEDFLKAKAQHFARLGNRNLPGRPWFRHQAYTKFLGERNRFDRNDLASSFAMLGGGAAISGNLALDREIILGLGKDNKTHAVDSIKGITVPEIDWTSQLPKEEVVVDPLSTSLPLGQYALFSPSLPILLETIDRAEADGMPLLQSFSAQNPLRGLSARYRKQLGLPKLNFLARTLPVESVAITGSDPFFPTGTAMALVFESKRSDSLITLLDAALSASTKIDKKELQIAGVTTQVRRDAEREISSYLAQIGDHVVIANSPSQIETLAAVAAGEAASLGASDEFKVFRHRYPLSDAHFIFLSDETIRHWASPKFRIAASRRTRARAALAELASRQIDRELGAKDAIENEFEPLLGDVRQASVGPVSEKFGHLHYMTPSPELAIETVTTAEKDAYERWRSGYESGWAQAFDPIAVEFRLSENSHEFDLTVLPLSINNELSTLMTVIGDSKLSSRALSVPTGALAHLAIGIDVKGEAFREFETSLTQFMPGLKVNPLAWLGSSLSITLHDGLFWEAETADNFGFDIFALLPVVLRAESDSRLKLALFLTGLKGAIQTSAPGLVRWENRKHGEQSYVAILADEKEAGMDLRIYYAALPEALIVTLDEDLMKTALDREVAAPADEPAAQAKHLFVETSPRFINDLQALDVENLERRARRVSWSALPILNEWHRLFPDQDPVEVHRKRFGISLYCPGGQGYRWNAEAKTMESVAYGYAAKPKMPERSLVLLEKFNRLTSGLSFADGGVRIQAKLEKVAAEAAPAAIEVDGAETEAITRYLSNFNLGQVTRYESTEGGETTKWQDTVIERGQPDENGFFQVKVRYDFEATTAQEAFSETKIHGVGPHTCTELETQSDDFKQRYKGEGLPMLPSQTTVGFHERFRVRSTTSLAGGETDECLHEVSFRILGHDDVKVKGGEFKDCLVVEMKSIAVMLGKPYRSIAKIWRAPGVGMVKAEYKFQGKTTVAELVGFDPKE